MTETINLTIVDIDYEVKPSGIWYKLAVIDSLESMETVISPPMCILHFQMKEYAKDEGYLDYVIDSERNGEHEQRTGTIGYDSFLEWDLNSKIIYSYLKSRGITQLSFDPTIL